MATIVHFDISVDDTERAKKFYQELFGWKFEMLPGPASYHLIETNGLDGEKGVGGGMSKREGSQPAGITNFMGVASVDESSKKVTEAGGRVIQAKQTLPGWGYLAVCTDTENNIFGLFQEDANAK